MNNVHIGGALCLNTVVTSREAILEQSRKIVMQQGLSAINMRTVAHASGISVGSVYNYFSSKEELIGAIVEDIWRDIFHVSKEAVHFKQITDCIAWIFERVQKGCETYPGFVDFHAMVFAARDKQKGRRMMERYFGYLKLQLRAALDGDPLVRPGAFGGAFSPELFIELVFSMTLTMIFEKKGGCAPLLEVVRRCIY